MTTLSNNLAEEIREIRTHAEGVVNGLCPDQLTRRPDPSKWSIAECLAHLNITADVVQPLIAQANERGKKEKIFGTGPFKLGARGRFLIWIASPPQKIKIKAPKVVKPPASIPDPSQVLPEFMQVQDEW